jgi:glycosidase
MMTLENNRNCRKQALFRILGFLLFCTIFLTPSAFSAQRPARSVFVHLFEWKWSDIAEECEQFLGPKGYSAVQVSPPNEHALITSPLYPWWQSYQPVSYKLDSRRGARAQFIDMVQRCNNVGVKIYADAVINHMTGWVAPGTEKTGIAGSKYYHYSYPDAGYDYGSFHHEVSGNPDNCTITNYQDSYNVRHCELAGPGEHHGLVDLTTEASATQQTIADYMNDLLDIGVGGFRFDAAKHMAPDDLSGILAKLNKGPGEYFLFQEVIDKDNDKSPYDQEAVDVSQYYATGNVTEFMYGLKLAKTFKDFGKLDWLSTFGESWNLMPSDKAVVFTDNHDNQRGHGGGGVLTYKDNANGKNTYTLANVFMLAWPYGYPKVMSSYDWVHANSDDRTNDWVGPPSDGYGHTNSIYDGNQNNVGCFAPRSGNSSNLGVTGGWICEHRWREIANMVDFRNFTINSWGIDHWWSNGENKIAFARVAKGQQGQPGAATGFVAINKEWDGLDEWLQTGMPASDYCNVIAADYDPTSGDCTLSPDHTDEQRIIRVQSDGKAHFVVGRRYAAAIHVGAKVTTDQAPVVDEISLSPDPAQAGQLLTVSAVVHDDHGVSRVEFYLDGVKKGEDTSTPYQISFGTPDRNGNYTLKVIAYDGKDQTGQKSTPLIVGQTPWKRTVIFMYGRTHVGQDMFIRGGLDHGYAGTYLGKNCTAANYACAIPIRHLNLRNPTTLPWKTGDDYLDWYGIESNQRAGAEGSPMDWTTTSDDNHPNDYASDGYGKDPENRWGAHYWKFDVEMDCSKTAKGWFELKSFISSGPGWESDVSQPGAPYQSGNHFAECGKLNVFKRGVSAPVAIEPLPKTQPQPVTDIVVHYKGWPHPNVYAWTGTSSALTQNWPGDPMKPESSDWYGYSFEHQSDINLIFISGNQQTGDLSRTAGEWWYKDNVWTDSNPEDTTPPTVQITSPLDGSVHTGVITLTVDATDNVGIEKVVYMYASKIVGESGTAPYSLDWDTAYAPNSKGTLQAIAYDLAGNSTEDQVSISTQNLNLPPVADAGDDIRIPVGGTARFDASGSYDPNGEIISYQWSNALSGIDPTRIYETEGDYLVTLTVTDNDGATATDHITVVVTPLTAKSDFREETIYFVMTSRFYDGDPSNNKYCWDDEKAGNLANHDPCWRGDFKGLIEKLDYIKALGFSAIWITPVVKNASGYDYHGYHAINHSEVDPRYESPGYDYQRLIDEAHARGLKVIQDVVFNHSGNFGEENLFPLFTRDFNDPATPVIETDPDGLLPANYDTLQPNAQYGARIAAMKEDENDTKHIYHHEKSLSWEGYTVETGQIAGDCVDLDTENPIVYNYLANAYGKYIDMGVDAFRVDTVKHISRLTFNDALLPPLLQRGGDDFFIFGEVASRYRQIWNNGIPPVSVPFYTWKESKNYDWGAREINEASTAKLWNDNQDPTTQPTSNNHRLNGNDYHAPDWSMRSRLDQIDFPMHWNFNHARDAFGLAVNDDKFYNDATWNVTYVDSHDYAPDGAPENQRFAGSQATWAENLSLMFTFRGIPTIYYGSEIEFKKGKVIDVGPNAPLVNTGRAYFGKHIDGTLQVSDFGRFNNANGAIADTLNYPLAKHIRRLNLIRRAVPALQKGQYSTDGISGGGMAFKRRYTADGVDSFALVTVSGDATFSGIPGGTYLDAVTGQSVSVPEGGSLTANAPGQGNLRVYVLNGPGKIGETSEYLF